MNHSHFFVYLNKVATKKSPRPFFLALLYFFFCLQVLHFHWNLANVKTLPGICWHFWWNHSLHDLHWDIWSLLALYGRRQSQYTGIVTALSISLRDESSKGNMAMCPFCRDSQRCALICTSVEFKGQGVQLVAKCRDKNGQEFVPFVCCATGGIETSMWSSFSTKRRAAICCCVTNDMPL